MPNVSRHRFLRGLFPGKEVTEKVPLESRQLVLGLGAMKSGTTWLSDYLGSHPHFFHSPIKEMNVFAALYSSNSAYPGYSYKSGASYRLWRMEKIVLAYGACPPRLDGSEFEKQRFDRLRALAQLGRIESTRDYLGFFEERIGAQLHFGEISPAYSHLPPEAYECMAKLTDDVRFLFLMRDPADRAASHLRHARRRVHKDLDVDQLLDRVNQDHSIYIRSDYRYTLQTLRSLGLAEKSMFLIYEDLFSQDSVDKLCQWLGIPGCKAVLDKRLNPGVGDSLGDRQMSILRQRLAPIYDGLRDDPATAGASRWRW